MQNTTQTKTWVWVLLLIVAIGFWLWSVKFMEAQKPLTQGTPISDEELFLDISASMESNTELELKAIDSEF